MEKLSTLEYCVLREKATEPAFTGKYWDHHERGTYTCRGCGTALFSSGTKYNSGSGWPSFWQPIDSSLLRFEPDTTWGMTRVEVICAKCGGHLGHVFDDGPKPTGKRYCINSAALDFQSSK
jgi:peptide-methionine (R)-S-oxide reductase